MLAEIGPAVQVEWACLELWRAGSLAIWRGLIRRDGEVRWRPDYAGMGFLGHGLLLRDARQDV